MAKRTTDRERDGRVLAIDFGTSFTVAVLASGGDVTEVRVDGESRFPSVVLVNDDGGFEVGLRALNAAIESPQRLVRPKRYVGQATLRAGGARVVVVQAVAAILSRVREAAARQGGVPARVVLTHPAGWEAGREAVLRQAAALAGLGEVELLPEPIAAAHLLAGTHAGEGERVAVYDLGGGTFDVAVLERAPNGWRTIGLGASDQIGGELFTDLVLEDLLVARLRRTAPDAWQAAVERGEQYLRRELRERARAAKHELSLHPSADVSVRPHLDAPALRITRDELDELISDHIHTTIDELETVLQDAGITAAELDALYLTGDSSRIHLVDRLLRERLGRAPDTAEDPKLIVARGALRPLALAPPEPPATPPPKHPVGRPARKRAPATQRPEPQLEITMPAMGESVTQGVVLEWLKQPGDPVEQDDGIVEISTNTVDAEVPAPASGAMGEHLVGEGDTVIVGQVLGKMTTGGASAPRRRRGGPSAGRPPAKQPAKKRAPRAAGQERIEHLTLASFNPLNWGDLHNIRVARWLVTQGTRVTRGTRLVELAVAGNGDPVRPFAPLAGRIVSLEAAESARVAPGEVLARIAWTETPTMQALRVSLPPERLPHFEALDHSASERAARAFAREHLRLDPRGQRLTGNAQLEKLSGSGALRLALKNVNCAFAPATGGAWGGALGRLVRQAVAHEFGHAGAFRGDRSVFVEGGPPRVVLRDAISGLQELRLTGATMRLERAAAAPDFHPKAAMNVEYRWVRLVSTMGETLRLLLPWYLEGVFLEVLRELGVSEAP